MDLPPLSLYTLPLFLALIAFEIWWFRRRGRSYPWREALTSAGVWVGQGAVGLLQKAVILGLYFALWKITPLRIPLDNIWVWPPLFVAVEFFYYAFHRGSHEIRWMWATHSVHHSSQQIHLVAAYRLGWTGLISGAWLFWVPLIVVGFHPLAVLALVAFNLIYQFWLHTEAIGKLPRWFEYAFNTPSHHRVHHAVNPAYLDRNYGGVLILFDRWFGTFAAERADEPCRYGLVHVAPTRNPFAVAFGEWGRLARDLRHARTWRERLGYALGRPGWRPDGAGATTADIRKAAGLAV